MKRNDDALERINLYLKLKYVKKLDKQLPNQNILHDYCILAYQHILGRYLKVPWYANKHNSKFPFRRLQILLGYLLCSIHRRVYQPLQTFACYCARKLT